MRILLLSWIFLVPLFQILLGIHIVLVFGQCLNDQRLLLLQLKNSLKFDETISTRLVNWNQTKNCSLWGGVTWDTGGRVIGLDLFNESISGGIDNSSALFGLQFLQSLNLSYNIFNSTQIPSGFSKLTRLRYLTLSNAGFSGQIPIEFSSMTRLVILNLSTFFPVKNRLKLENPNLRMLVQNLTELTELYLDGVNISAQGSDWCQVLSSSLPNLQVLSLSNCYLPGPIDYSLVKLQSLSDVRLNRNNLSSPVPKFFANLTNLTVLSLSSCNLSDVFPEDILNLPTLQTLDLSNNELLHGSLPEIPQNSSLQTLVLSYTKFSGILPDSINNSRMLSRIDISNCDFSGPIPNSVASLTKLVYLDFSSNNFSGSVPPFISAKNLTHINLFRNNLTGEIPSSHWEGLHNLVSLDLRSNSLNGSIPLSLFSLQSLQRIQLSNNKFDGEFNHISNVSYYALETLDLSSNKLKGPLPMFVFGLPGLKILSLSFNNFNGSVEPSKIEKLKNLTTLDLSYNNLSISDSGHNFNGSSFPQLSTLKLASCKLRVSPNLKNQSKLIFLDLSDNQIQGKIPNWMWKINSLGHLNLSYNMFTGFEEPSSDLPSSLSVLDLHSNQLQGQIPLPPFLQSAAVLDYSNNNFSFAIPVDMGNLISGAVFLSLANNRLIGTIPPSICNATYLQVLDLSNNELNGTIPSCLIQRSENLEVLNLRGNKLSGTIPDEFPQLCKLKTLDFSRNQIEGWVPKTLANCTLLEVLNLGNNQINDNFPCWLKNSYNLRVLVLQSNRLSGPIGCPPSKSNWPMLQIIDLASNNFRGSLQPQYFSTWKAMRNDEDQGHSELNHLHVEIVNGKYYQDTVTVTSKGLEMELVKILSLFTSIDFSNNHFEGAIPAEIGDLKSLYVLNLSRNAFNSTIPPSIGNLKQLESLDLSQNNLAGGIPMQLVNLNFLSFFDVSYNQLTGSIPRGRQFNTFAATSYEGNRGLCGPILNTSCGNTTMVPPPPSPSNSSNDSVTNMETEFDWQFIYTGLGFGIGAGIIIGPLMFWKQGRNWCNDHIDKLLLMILPTYGFIHISCNNLKVEAEESIDDEATDDTEEEDEDEMENEAFRGRYCVFCTKLDMCRKKAVHNPKCTCHDTPSISSSSASSSSSLES